MKKFLPIICCVLLIISVFSLLNIKVSSEAKNDNNVIVGSWIRQTNSNLYLLQFTENGICRRGQTTGKVNDMNSYRYTYDANNNIVKVETGNGTLEYHCYICGNGMITDFFDKDGYSYIYTKT